MKYLAIISMLFLVGCSSELTEARKDPDQVIIRDPKQRPIPISEIEKLTLKPPLNGFWQYGLLSAASYSPELNTLKEICPLPSKFAARWLKDAEFTEKAFAPERDKDFGFRVPGFGYSIWSDVSKRGPKKVAVVFRGTDFTELGDWYSNARWITRMVPVTWDQYQQTRDLMPPLVENLKAKYGEDVEIISTGHSLGGGLAQHAAYSSRDINTVYAFASSPVTGASSLDRRVDAEGVTTFRVYESGEVLSSLRWISRRVVPLSQENPDVKEARFSLREQGHSSRRVVGRAISQHSIQQFTCDLICRVEYKMSSEECSQKATID